MSPSTPNLKPRQKQPPRTTGRRAALNLRAHIKIYTLCHMQVALGSIGRLYRRPVSTLLIAAVLGIALALPGGFYLLLKNLRLTTQSIGTAQISVFLQPTVDDMQAEQFAQTLTQRDDIIDVHTITRTAALEEFRRLSGFGTALDALQDNPLPAVVVITPRTGEDGTAALSALLLELGQLPQVDFVQRDLRWLERLHAGMALGQRISLLTAALLGLGALLIVANTIRLDIYNRREEIEVAQLIGATDAFIRRPFLYGGLWYGIAGGVVACLLIEGSLMFLRGSVERLAMLYDGDFSLASLNAAGVFMLMTAAISLSLIGSWLAVQRYLRAPLPA